MNTTPESLQTGQRIRVVGFIKDKQQAHRAGRQKLLSMGLTPGIEFEVARIAPMGDPVEIKVRGFFLSLRREEVAMLQIELIQDTL